MQIKILSADALTPEHKAAWSDIQQSEPSLDSPYFRPEFTQAVASVRGGVEVAVLERGGEPVGFFPFQRGAGNIARPVGGKLSDFHGVVVRSGVQWEPRQLLRECRLRAWHFDHLIAAQEPLRPHHWSVAPSPYLDLSRGWEGYQSDQLASHKAWFKGIVRKLRYADRDAGPVRFEVQSRDPAVFHSLIKWKVQQYEKTVAANVLGRGWTVALLERVLAANDAAFSGMMSALYLGDSLAAVVLSMRSYGVVHGWFSAYCLDFAKFSPGLIFWLELARAYPALGVRRFDLGKGPEEYKTHFMSGAIDVAEGSVDLRPLAGMVRRGFRRTYDWARRSPLRRPLLAPGRMIRNMLVARELQ
jgi:CelD/BcsL family acetyltransferase involved in cellulose biosynthesis